MSSPTPPRNSESEVPIHHLLTPTVRIFSALAILVTGLGIASVFWKMPNGNDVHALYHKEVIDQDLTALTLPNESMALLTPEERAQISLPMLDIEPVMGGGTEKYTQIYEPPAALAIREPEQEEAAPPAVEEELLFPQQFEPMRQVVDERPLAVEIFSKDFQPKPDSVSTAEKSDEMTALFLFAENNRIELDSPSEPQPPMDPFSTSTSTLQPLQPLHIGNLSPLHPL